ncbi:uncharacterized protein LOC128209840 [Mya arenaria]|uniref:uncharacterized protein LOC128209840 n=1 Tax=Mya arenaria TaxID=6604 RepID=UPI0022E6DFB9|nr:uncharacterized protein LOC128209840 [Mya arenaria]
MRSPNIVTLLLFLAVVVNGRQIASHHLATKHGNDIRDNMLTQKRISTMLLGHNHMLLRHSPMLLRHNPMLLGHKRLERGIFQSTTGPYHQYRPPLLLASSECAAIDKCSCTKDLTINRPKIDCKSQKLQEIPKFKLLNTVYFAIDLQWNLIKSVPNNSFANLKVNRIDLLENKIQNIDIDAFKGVEELLEELLISGNDLLSIPFSSIIKLRYLRRLALKHFTQQTPVGLNYLSFFPRLEALEFSDINKLQVNVSASDGVLPKLQHLELRNVYIQEIPLASLQFLTSLRALYIRHNDIPTLLGRSFERLTNLRDLDLSYNNINLINRDCFLQVSRSLNKLNLGTNSFTSSSLEALSSQQWPNLETLILSYNNGLRTMPGSVFQNMPDLRYLYMTGVGITTVSGSLLYGLQSLTSLDLSYNNIETIQDNSFAAVGESFELKLDNQFHFESGSKALTVSPNSFSGSQEKIYFLNLDNTPLAVSQFWNTLKTLTTIKEVLLQKTGLTDIPELAFENNKDLNKLDIRENSIKSLKLKTFKGLENSLSEIDISVNNLDTLSECIFQNFTKLQVINLRANPLHCDCRLVWLHQHLNKEVNFDNIYREEVMCASPAHLANKVLYQVPLNDLKCENLTPVSCSETGKPTTASPTTIGPVDNQLKLSIPNTSPNSITVYWSVRSMSGITGYKLEYFVPSDVHQTNEVNIHRDVTLHVIHKLRSGTFYTVCVTGEVNQAENAKLRDCRTIKTEDDANKSSGQNGNIDNDELGKSRQIMIGAIIASVAIIVLIAVGVCAVIKYRYKAKRMTELLALTSPVRQQPHVCGSREDMANFPYPAQNDYTEINPAQLAHYLAGSRSPRNLQRQFGFESLQDDSPYNTMNSCQRMRFRRKNPYENDDEEYVAETETQEESDEETPQIDEGVCFSNSEEILFKTDLAERHSAPSRLDGKSDRNSRPLPATPAEQGKTVPAKDKRRSNTMQQKKGKKKRNEKTNENISTVSKDNQN